MEQSDELRSKTYLVMLCLNANLGALTSGIFLTAFNACFYQVVSALKSHTSHQDLIIAGLSAIIPLGAIFGSLVSSLLATKFARKNLMIIMDFLAIIACIISQSSFLSIMLFGRALCGFVCGANFFLIPLYVRELLPSYMSKYVVPLFRGMFAVGVCLSFLVGYFSQKPPSEPNSVWVGVFVMPAVFALIRLMLLIFWANLDTPRFYLKQGNDTKAWEAITKIYNDDYLDDVFRRERKISMSFRIRYILSHEYRRQLLVVIFIIAFTQLMGGSIANFYSTMIFFGRKTDRTAQEYKDVGVLNIFIGCTILLTNISSNTVSRILSRRQLLIYGAVGLCLFSLLISLAELMSFMFGQTILLILFAAIHNLTFDLISTTYAFELLPSYSLVLQVTSEMLAMLIVVFVFPIIGIELGFVIFGIMAGIGFMIAFKMVNENKEMTPLRVHRLFQSFHKGLLDDEVTIPTNSMDAMDDLRESEEAHKFEVNQEDYKYVPFY